MTIRLELCFFGCTTHYATEVFHANLGHKVGQISYWDTFIILNFSFGAPFCPVLFEQTLNIKHQLDSQSHLKRNVSLKVLLEILLCDSSASVR